MNLRWLFFDFVDPKLGLDRETRRAVRSRARDFGMDAELRNRYRPTTVSGRRKQNFFAGLMILTPGLVMLGVMQLFNFSSFSNASVWYMIAIAILVQLLLSWIIMAAVARFSGRPQLLWALHERGVELCRSCGYWLRDLPDSTRRCPECGEDRIENENSSIDEEYSTRVDDGTRSRA